MIRENNGWYCTDNDCMQYCRSLGNRRYEFVQVIWLDTCGNDKRAKNDSDNYVVVTDSIDMNDYDEEDIEMAICGYYQNIKEMEESYGLPLGELDDIVAECFFENMSFITDCHSDIVSWNDAEDIIQDFINTGSLMEFGKNL